MGFFAGLNDEKYDRQYTDRELTRRIVDFFKPQKRRLAWTTVLVVAYAALGASLPVLVAYMVDGLANQPTLQAITLVSLAVLIIGIGLWGLNWARRSLVIRAVGDGVLDLRTSRLPGRSRTRPVLLRPVLLGTYRLAHHLRHE